MNNMDVSIVIPNWNGRSLLEKHLAKCISTAKKSEILIVDDASDDDSIEFLEKTYPQIRVIKNLKTKGFSSNINAGVKAAHGEIVILLNTDIEPEDGYIEPLLAYFSDPKTFAVGCMDKSHEGNSIILRGRGVGWWEKGFYYHKKGDVDKTDTAWVSGGSGAFRKEIWEKLGGMDTLFDPFYWEDIDLSYRARKSGYKVFFEPKSIVHHFHEEGKIKHAFSKDEIAAIAFRNQFFFIWKNVTDRRIIVLHVMYLPIRLAQAVFRFDWMFIKGFFLAFGKFPTVLKKRSLSLPLFIKTDEELSQE